MMAVKRLATFTMMLVAIGLFAIGTFRDRLSIFRAYLAPSPIDYGGGGRAQPSGVCQRSYHHTLPRFLPAFRKPAHSFVRSSGIYRHRPGTDCDQFCFGPSQIGVSERSAE